jgi:predicted transcriptional regulator
MAAEIAAAFVRRNNVKADELPKLIEAVYRSLEEIAEGKTEETTKPAVSIRRSVKPDHIVCLEDGQEYKTLKRHLRAQHGMTPDAYRAKWNLKSDYPMVAPQYAAQRAALAKSIGLGKANRRKSTKASKRSKKQSLKKAA